MLSQNAVHPYAKGTMMLQKLVDAASRIKEKRKKLSCPRKKKTKSKKKINKVPPRSRS